MKEELRDNLLKLLGKVISDGIDAETADARIDSLKTAGSIFVQIAKLDAKNPDDDDDDQNFGTFHEKLKSVEKAN